MIITHQSVKLKRHKSYEFFYHAGATSIFMQSDVCISISDNRFKKVHFYRNYMK